MCIFLAMFRRFVTTYFLFNDSAHKSWSNIFDLIHLYLSKTQFQCQTLYIRRVIAERNQNSVLWKLQILWTFSFETRQYFVVNSFEHRWNYTYHFNLDLVSIVNKWTTIPTCPASDLRKNRALQITDHPLTHAYSLAYMYIICISTLVDGLDYELITFLKGKLLYHFGTSLEKEYPSPSYKANKLLVIFSTSYLDGESFSTVGNKNKTEKSTSSLSNNEAAAVVALT